MLQVGMICRPGILPLHGTTGPAHTRTCCWHGIPPQGKAVVEHCIAVPHWVAAQPLHSVPPCWCWPAPATVKMPPTEVELRLTAAEQLWGAAQPRGVGESQQTGTIQCLPMPRLPTMTREIAEQITQSSHVESW